MPGSSHHRGSGHYRVRVLACDLCGHSPEAPAADEDVPLTWVTSVEDGRRRHYCERCAREHLRSIEAKLDAEWW